MEKNRYKRAWIWIWYNDITRLCIFTGIPFIPLIIFAPKSLGYVYVLFLAWMWFDNDYSNLRRIGMDEYRNKLRE